jgi:hypothetical protein
MASMALWEILNVALTDCFPLRLNMVDPGNGSSIFGISCSLDGVFIINFIPFEIVMKFIVAGFYPKRG